MATTFIRVPQTGGAPEDYLVSGAADIDLLSCAARFDGSGAGVDFVPAIQILDEAGQVSATVKGPTVTAGGSADVTFAPFLENPDGSGPVAAGIQFDLYPQAGDNLYVETNGNPGFAPWHGGFAAAFPTSGPSGFDDAEGILNVAADGTQYMVYSEGGEIDLYADPALSGVLRFNAHQWFVNSHFIQIDASQDLALSTTSIFGSTPTIEITSAKDLTLQTGNQRLVIVGLPTSNPGGSGRVWNNGGVLNIT